MVHRSWLRTKLSEKSSQVADKVTERARSVIPLSRDTASDKCMVCGRVMRKHHLGVGNSRVCSTACARRWAKDLT